MITQIQQPQPTRNRAKKPKNKAMFGNAHSQIIVVNTFKEKSAAPSHSNLRSSSLQSRLGKSFNSFRAWRAANQRQTHGVELTDDVIVVGRNGQRVLPPDYTTLRIDQLPQFRKK